MSNKNWNKITDAELDIMNALWEIGTAESPAIFNALETNWSSNRGTKKTVLARLVKKGVIERVALNNKAYLYSPAISKEEYINEFRKWMIKRVFDGDAKKMLANLIKDESITREDLEMLLHNTVT